MSNIMDIQEILKLLPHRYPFLLLDRIIDLQLGKSLVAIKNVTMNELFFTGHFPERPVMPGVLILEAMAQAGAVLAYKTMDCTPSDGVLYYLAAIDRARFRRVVVPGDQLRFEVKFVRAKGEIWKLAGEAFVGDELACSADFMSARKISED